MSVQKVNVSIETSPPDSAPGWGVLGQSVENVYIELQPLVGFLSWEVANWLGVKKETFSRFCGAARVQWPKRGRELGSGTEEAWIRVGFSHILQTPHLYFFINQHFRPGQQETTVDVALSKTSDKTAPVRIRLEWPKVQMFIPVGPTLVQAIGSETKKRAREETPTVETKKPRKAPSFIILEDIVSSLCNLAEDEQ